MSLHVQVSGAVLAQFFKAFLLMLAKFPALGNMTSKAVQKVAEVVGVFDSLAGHRGLVYTSANCCCQQAQAHFVQDLVP